MRPRTLAELYQTAARIWMSSALLSLLLPADARVGIWLPLHLALAGAASVAICGAMQTFVLAMTASKQPPPWKQQFQFALVNLGVLLVGIGYPLGWQWLLAIGGAIFVASILILGYIVRVAWVKALNKRHAVPVLFYAGAIVSMLAGGVLGALVGAGVVEGATWVELRGAHLTLNVLGWISLTIAGTLITLLPTTLRIRMPVWRGRPSAWLFMGGAAVLATGWTFDSHPMKALGAIVYAVGALSMVVMVRRVLATERKWPMPISAKHLLCAFVWFVLGSVALAIQAVRGSDELTAFRDPFLLVFVGGWMAQTLLGAWMFLLPMWRAGHPEERRRSWAAVEILANVQLFALNAGLLILVMRAGTPEPGPAAVVGLVLTLIGVGLAMVKAWGFRVLAKGPVVNDRTRRMWWAEGSPGAE